jgi:hypothetical protein
MVSKNKIVANQKNALCSTGPRSVKGKAKSKMNALAHGLRAEALIIPGERAEDWEAHRSGTIASLAPLGTLEAELAERVAILTWRLRRAVAYETAVTASGIARETAQARGEEEGTSSAWPSTSQKKTYTKVQEELESAKRELASFEELRDQCRRLPALPGDHPFSGDDAFSFLLQVTGYTPDADKETTNIEDHEFLAAIGVPEDARDDPDWWHGWTAILVRNGVREIAREAGMTAEQLLHRVVRDADREATLNRRKVARLDEELAELEGPTAEAERVAHGRALLPSGDLLDKIARYEGHLSRQLGQALLLLERLQDTRAGKAPEPRNATEDFSESATPALALSSGA